MVTPPAARRQSGFSLLELMIGAAALGIILVFFGFFMRGQIAGAKKSERLASATQVALGALEETKNLLADSARFAERFDEAKHGGDADTRTAKVNRQKYDITLTYAPAPAPLYALKVRAKVRWNMMHAVDVGVLIPGPSRLMR